ncbi:MAG TPA: hypothetical protein VGP72_23535 [Planctomycetota bacterium]|jgi:hypothetical protein
MKASVTPARIWAARGIAVAADLVQLAFVPLFAEGFVSPFNAVLDGVVCVALTLLVGWHIAFLPSFIIEQLPIADLAPTWTIAIIIATRTAGLEGVPPAAKPAELQQ